RKSEGPKLGRIVAKDLRKQTTHCFGKQPPRPEVSPLDLELPGKKLTDEGCLAMVEALAQTLEMRDGVSANKLQSLNLSGNELTTVSLQALAAIIKLAAFDLTDLDLSNNKITVKTNKEAEEWEAFLQSFSECRVLRRIVFSGNDLSGSRPFEILTRVYAKQMPVDPTELEDTQEHSESDDALEDITNQTRSVNIDVAREEPKMTASLSDATFLKRRQGLRAVPYMVFDDANMTDSGALYLSYILAMHYPPQYLMCPLRAGPQATQLDEYNQRNHCWGIVYLPNTGFTEVGQSVLSLAEDARADFAGVEPDLDQGKVNASSESFQFVNAKQGGSDISQNYTDPTKKHSPNMDIDNYRKKIQRAIIGDVGYDSVDMWRMALTMLAYARVVMLGKEPDEDSLLPGVTSHDPVHAYASKMMATTTVPGEPILAITGVSDKPSAPQVIDYTSLPRASGHPNKPSPPSDHWKDYPQTSNVSSVIEADNRDSGLSGDLPEALWQQILAEATGCQGVLSDVQQKNIIRYARDPATTAFEQQGKSKPESAQLLLILDAMGCLEYKLDS
ncbi:uncharacterized protein K452DRAFT_236556, partial [Aplosporella prunicola CBS 121167]